ncbi:hypothetical protein [Singulisphaera sp. PoT]|uniref:hypothetical protein n=1 Tax=Singulisphaera sp. PoT TaxID=3411797 RepID=UPI003BF5C11A
MRSDLAGVVKLTFRLTHDVDVRQIQLDYNLEIVPVFFQFNPHARLEIPLEGYDEAVVQEWLDDRIIEFAKTYMQMHDTKEHERRVMVSDTVAGVSFPGPFTAATLDFDGSTYDFISEASRRELVMKHGLPQ